MHNIFIGYALISIVVLAYVDRLVKAYKLASTEITGSKGMKHLKFQQFSPKFRW